MQRGHFYQAHGAWHLWYRVNGKQVSIKLADYTDEYRTLKSVRPLAEPYLQTANSGQRADGHLTLQQYAETVYFTITLSRSLPTAAASPRNNSGPSRLGVVAIYSEHRRNIFAGVK